MTKSIYKNFTGKINEFFSSKDGMLFKKFLWLKDYLIGAGAGEKNTRSRSKTDQLHNTANNNGKIVCQNS